MKILYVGELYYGSTCLMRKKAFESLGHNVKGVDVISSSPFIRSLDRINFRLSYAIDFDGLNRRIVDEFEKDNYDIVWIDKGKKIFSKTLKKLKEINRNVKLVHINPDDPFGKFRTGWMTFIKSIPLYDIHFVAREVNVTEYKSIGAKSVYVYDRSYDPDIHKPIELTEEEKKKYFCKVGFIGAWAVDREKSIAFLINNGIEVAVWGNDWPKGNYWETIRKYYKGKSLNGIEYSKAINGMEIALHFLRRENRDEQDSRTFEIPACGTFMIAERTKKHEQFFEENEEVVFFETDPELLDKLIFYINNEKLRMAISRKAYHKISNFAFTHKGRLKKMLDMI